VVRVGHGPRIYLRAAYGTPEFEAEYHAAIRGDDPRPRRGKGSDGALGWLVARWQASSEWATLARATQRQRINILKHVLAEAETFPFREIGKAEIIAGRERRAATPSQANNFLNTMRSLFKWAVANDFLESNPTDGVKNIRAFCFWVYEYPAFLMHAAHSSGRYWTRICALAWRTLIAQPETITSIGMRDWAHVGQPL
jgi:hypothetical protein